MIKEKVMKLLEESRAEMIQNIQDDPAMVMNCGSALMIYGKAVAKAKSGDIASAWALVELANGFIKDQKGANAEYQAVLIEAVRKYIEIEAMEKLGLN